MAEIAAIKTIPLSGEGVETHGIMVAVNTGDVGMPNVFVAELAKTISLHRLCSPPDTSVLVVSVIGAFDAARFQEDWVQAVTGEAAEMKALRFFLSEMRIATLSHGKRDGTVLQTVRLSPG
jgi:hypothetical protein